MAKFGNERPSVQDPLVKYATEIGWKFVSEADALIMRHGETGVFFYDTLRSQLLALNPNIVTEENVDDVINRIENVRANIEGNAETLAWLRGERSIYVPVEKRERNVTVIDFYHPDPNIFQVTVEWEYTNGRYTNRADVMFLINGIPVAVVETKSAKKTDGIDIGIKQIRRYHRETPEMLIAPQVFDVTHLIDFYYGVTWNLDRKGLFNWKDEEPGNFEKKVKRFFDQERFLKLLRDWIIFFQKDGELNKIILRQHQTRAVEKVVMRAVDPTRRRGLIWHTQGSGKTFTMIVAAQQILRHPVFGKPTVIMLIDRNELEGQLSGWIARVLGEKSAVIADSKRWLREWLKSDYRGLIVSMIHKFDKADANLCIRENVIVLVDEAHRTTGGDLGNYLLGALPNASIIGFTGTPIDKTAYGQGTFKVFGCDDPEGYLDKYPVAESIEDGTTLPLRYTLVPNELKILVPQEQLEREFLALAETEGISDIEDLNRILDNAVKLKEFLKSDDRIDKVAQFVAKHFKENVEPLGYKAFLVGVDREACALYKEALDKYLPSEYSRVVYTSAHNDNELLAKYRISEDEEKQVRKAFIKRDALPKILIVTEKLLTGFDAPILYCMYLDKPMRDHALLQAIARVNRPYEEEGEIRKPSGLVVDFVGIFDKLEKALAFDSDVVSGVIENLDVLKDRFEKLMKEVAPTYLALTMGTMDDKAVERAIEALSDKDKREEFYKFFKEIQTFYEIISPDELTRLYLDDYQRLAALYQLVRNTFGKSVPLLKDLMKKTEVLVREKVTAEGLTTTLPIYEINEKTLEEIKESYGSYTSDVKVINLIKSLQSAEQKANEQPFLIPIGERAQAIAEAYEDRQIDAQEALKELEKLVDEKLEAEREQAKKGFDINTFSIYWVLKKEGISEADVIASQLNTVLRQHPNWQISQAEERQVRIELTKVFVRTGLGTQAAELVKKVLKLQRVTE